MGSVNDVFLGPGGSAPISIDGNNRLLSVSQENGTINLWEIQTGNKIRTLRHDGQVMAMVLSNDGNCLVSSTGTGIGSIWVWNTGTGELTARFDNGFGLFQSMVLSKDKRLLVTGEKDGVARIWDIGTGKQIRAYKGHSSAITCIFLTDDCRSFVTGSDDNTARLWDVRSGDELQAFRGHSDKLTAVALSNDNKLLFSSSWDSTVAVWETKTAKELCKLVTFADGAWLVFDRDGRFDISNDDIQGVCWFDGLEPIPLGVTKNRFYDPGLLAKQLGLHKDPPRVLKRGGNDFAR